MKSRIPHHGFVADASIEPETETTATLVIKVQQKDGKTGGFSFNAGDRLAENSMSRWKKSLRECLPKKTARASLKLVAEAEGHSAKK